MSIIDSRRSWASRPGRRPSHTRMRLERLEDRTAPTVVPVGGEFLVNTYTMGTQARPSVAINPAGNFVVAWHGEQSGDERSVFAQRYTAAGVPQGSEFRVNSNPDGLQLRPSVTMDSAGNFVVAWDTDVDVNAQRYNSAGEPQGGEFRVNTYTSNRQVFASVAMDPAGNFVVTWISNGQDGSDQGVYAQRYDAAGLPQGDEFRVNTYTTDSQSLPSVAMDSAGNFVVAWASNGQGGVYAQRYNSAGVPQGGEFRVNNGDDPSVAMDPAGNFVVVWSAAEQDDSDGGVYAQRYDAAGLPQGDKFRVNTYTDNYQGAQSVAMDQAGNFVVAWQGQGTGGVGGIHAQAYRASGAPDGGEFRVNGGNFPSIAMDMAGNFVVVWYDTGRDGDDQFNSNVYAQRYKLSQAPLVSTVRVNDGSAQRSRVTSLMVTFDAAVSFAGPVSSAFALTRIGGGAVSLRATATLVGGVTVVTLDAFTGSETEFGSLRDGRYTLTALASQISVNGQPLDGNGDGLGGDDYVLTGSAANGLYRLYGDGNGDGFVNAADFAQFRGAFGSATGQAAYVEWLDLDGDGFINAFDFAQFRTRFGASVP